MFGGFFYGGAYYGGNTPQGSGGGVIVRIRKAIDKVVLLTKNFLSVLTSSNERGIMTQERIHERNILTSKREHTVLESSKDKTIL